jgi:hypothetical protein
MSKPKSSSVIGKSSKVTCLRAVLPFGRQACLLLLWHPAYRQREFITGVRTERKNLSSRWQEKTSSNSNYKRESIDAWHGGGTSRSSEEASVMGVERRGSIIKLSTSLRKLSVGRTKQEVLN